MRCNKIIPKMLNKLAYQVHKTDLAGNYVYLHPYNYVTYSPWFEDWFQAMYGKIKDHTLVTEDRCYTIQRFCDHCLHLDGDFAECGVYKGGTAFLIADTLMNHSIRDKELHLFDTFAGMPSIADEDPSGLKEGDCGDVSLSVVKKYLQTFPFLVFHPGIIPETFKGIEDRKFAFVHIDVDLYESVKDCCSFFYDRMVIGAIMIFDDYGTLAFAYSGKKAVDDFFYDKPETPISLHTGQCIVIKL